MILGRIEHYSEYRHIESKRIVEIRDTELQIKTDGEWKTAVSYVCKDDESGQVFAVPLDDFRRRFEKIKPETT